MNNPWDTEFPLDPATVPALIEAQFPQLGPVTANEFGSGWDNIVYRVNDAYLFRFPKRQEALELVDLECRVLPTLSQLLPLPIPNPIFIGRPTSVFPHLFFGYEMLMGDTACTRELDHAGRRRIAPQLGTFLAALHGMGNQLSHLSITPDTYQRTLYQRQKKRIDTTLDKLTDCYSSEEMQLARELAAQSCDCPVKTGVPVHGDLYIRHLLLDKAGDISGVIDWGDFHLGDPVVDLTAVWTLFPKTVRPLFWQAYGKELEADRVPIARIRALGYAAVLTNFARDIGDRLLQEESMRILHNVLDL